MLKGNQKNLKKGKVVCMKRMILMFLILCLIGGLSEAVPMKMNYQGRLTNSDGNPLSGDYNIQFKIYDVESGGSALWTEDHSGVPVSNGIFNVVLGDNTSLESSDFTDGGQRWLGINVAGDGEMIPRRKIVSVAYSINADMLDGHEWSEIPAGGDYVAKAGDTMTGLLTVDAGMLVPANDVIYFKDTNSALGSDGTDIGFQSDGDIVLIPSSAVYVGDGTADTDYSIIFDANSSTGTITWMEDENYFSFADSILLNDTVLYLSSTSKSIDGATGSDIGIDCADGKLDIGTDTVDIGEAGDTDIVLNFDANSNDGSITWMEDEARFDFSGAVSFEGDLTVGDTIEANRVDINGTTGIEFQSLADVWAFKYGSASGADDTGVFFNTVSSAIEFRLTDINFAQFLTNGDIKAYQDLYMGATAGNRNPVFYGVGDTSTGSFTWMENVSYWQFDDNVRVDTNQNLHFGTDLNDKISLYDDRAGSANMYGFGVETNCLFSRSPNLFRWYINTLADAGVSDYMELGTTGLSIGRDGQDIDVQLNFRSNSNDGLLTWMEDEDEFRFQDNVSCEGTVFVVGNADIGGDTTLGNASGDITTINDILLVTPRATAPYSTSTPEGTVWMDSSALTMKVYLGGVWNQCFTPPE